MEQHDIFCGGLKPPTKPKLERVLELDVQGDSKNIEFKIESISKAMMANIPDERLVSRSNMAGHFSCGRHGHFLAYYSICSREVRHSRASHASAAEPSQHCQPNDTRTEVPRAGNFCV